MKQFWSSLIDNDYNKIMKINLYTVESLQLFIPGVSCRDVKTVQDLILSSKTFTNLKNSDHAAIWNKLQEKREIILSLHTFFQDLYYLEVCTNCVKQLIILSRLHLTL